MWPHPSPKTRLEDTWISGVVKVLSTWGASALLAHPLPHVRPSSMHTPELLLPPPWTSYRCGCACHLGWHWGRQGSGWVGQGGWGRERRKGQWQWRMGQQQRGQAWHRDDPWASTPPWDFLLGGTAPPEPPWLCPWLRFRAPPESSGGSCEHTHFIKLGSFANYTASVKKTV